MADNLGRRGRWTAALVVAPGAVALFGGAVSWAQHVTPATSAEPPHTSATAAAAQQREYEALGKATHENALRAQALRREIDSLRKELDAAKNPARPHATGAAGGSSSGNAGGVAGGSSSGAGSGGSVSTGSGSSGSSGGGGSGGTRGSAAPPPAAAPPPPPAAAPPPPPPPPPVQVTTGASGHP